MHGGGPGLSAYSYLTDLLKLNLKKAGFQDRTIKAITARSLTLYLTSRLVMRGLHMRQVRRFIGAYK